MVNALSPGSLYTQHTSYSARHHTLQHAHQTRHTCATVQTNSTHAWHTQHITLCATLPHTYTHHLIMLHPCRHTYPHYALRAHSCAFPLSPNPKQSIPAHNMYTIHSPSTHVIPMLSLHIHVYYIHLSCTQTYISTMRYPYTQISTSSIPAGTHTSHYTPHFYTHKDTTVCTILTQSLHGMRSIP